MTAASVTQLTCCPVSFLRPSREVGRPTPTLVEALFAFMQRNSAHPTEYLRLPMDSVVEIGREVSI